MKFRLVVDRSTRSPHNGRLLELRRVTVEVEAPSRDAAAVAVAETIAELGCDACRARWVPEEVEPQLHQSRTRRPRDPR